MSDKKTVSAEERADKLYALKRERDQLLNAVKHHYEHGGLKDPPYTAQIRALEAEIASLEEPAVEVPKAKQK